MRRSPFIAQVFSCDPRRPPSCDSANTTSHKNMAMASPNKFACCSAAIRIVLCALNQPHHCPPEVMEVCQRGSGAIQSVPEQQASACREAKARSSWPHPELFQMIFVTPTRWRRRVAAGLPDARPTRTIHTALAGVSQGGSDRFRSLPEAATPLGRRLSRRH